MNIFTTFRDMSRGPRVICRIRPFEDNCSLVNFNTVAVAFLEFLDMKFFINFFINWLIGDYDFHLATFVDQSTKCYWLRENRRTRKILGRNI